MKLEIQIISIEMITPSSPTPPHLNSHKISYLDQTMPHLLTPFVLFYPANYENNLINNSQRSNLLKKSLSQALNLFYPLAGRLADKNYVTCNDEGVTFVEAQANCCLSDVLIDPNPNRLEKFLPFDPVHDAKDHCMAVQVTFFDCGGLALVLEVSHKIFDGFSQFMFINYWASFSRTNNSNSPFKDIPKFESSILFPPKDSVTEIFEIEKRENIVTKRFVFSSEKISELRDKYTKKNTSIRPTRIETLSAFIGYRFVVSIGDKEEYSNKIYALRIFVDIRTRVVPSLSQYHFGNIVSPAIVLPSLKDFENGTNDGIVKKLRDAISNVDGDSLQNLRRQPNEVVMLSFTNYCSIPLHEANFGWGIPKMIVGPNIPVNNTVFFNNSLSGDGIDAWVNLKEEDMIKFETDMEMFEYVSDTKLIISKM